MTQVSDKEQRARLRSLYRIAITLTDDPDEATRLLDTTAARIKEDPTLHGLAPRQWFTQVVAAMLEIHYEDLPAEPANGFSLEDEDPSRSAQHDPRKVAQLIRPVVRDRLPIVWATLSEYDRTVLMLVDVEGLQLGELATAIGQSPAEAETRLQQAREVLSKGLYAELTPGERALARQVLTPERIGEMLRSHVRDGGSRTTPSLPESVAAALIASLEARRPRSSPAPKPTRRSRAPQPARRRLVAALRYVLLAAAIVVAIGLIGYLAAQYFEEAPETNLITLSAERASEITPVVRTDQLDEAERFIFEQQGTRLILPSIDQAVLMGASLTQVASGIEVPTFLYEENTGDTVALYAYNYRLLDRHGDRLQLTSDVLRQIEDDTQYDIHDLGTSQVLIWRHRSTIYVAVTESDASELRNRIIMPS